VHVALILVSGFPSANTEVAAEAQVRRSRTSFVSCIPPRVVGPMSAQVRAIPHIPSVMPIPLVWDFHG